MSYSWQQYPPQGAYHQPGSNQTAHSQQPSLNIPVAHSLGTNSSQVPSQTGVSSAQGQPPTGAYPPHPSQYPPQTHYHQGPFNSFGGWGVTNGGPQAQSPYGAHGAYAHLSYGHYAQQPWVSHQTPYGHPGYGPNAYQAQATFAYKQHHQHKVAQPSLSTCFNCGDPSHWAQDCPKPRQAVPHGQMIQANKRRPNYVPPVVTKYPVPPHVASGQPNLHSQSPNIHSGFPTPPTQYGPSTVGEQSPQASQNSYWHRSSNNPSVGIAPSTPHSINMSPTGPNQHRQSYDSVISGQPPSYGSRASSVPSRKASMDQSVSMESNSDAGIDEENLSLLDVPDFPRNHGNIIAKPPVPVRHPLPSFSDSDEMGRILEPESTSDGKVQSKYINKCSEKFSNSSFQELKALEGRHEDPLFTRIASRSSSTSPRPRKESPTTRVSDHKLGHSLAQDAGIKGEVSAFDVEDSQPRQPCARYEIGHSLPPRSEPFHELDENEGSHHTRPPRENLQRQASWSYATPNHSPTRDTSGHKKRRHSSTAINNCARRFTDSSPTVDDQMQRKRKHEPYEDEQESPNKRRQYDNVTPKPKLNQPKVAAAYNRRW